MRGASPGPYPEGKGRLWLGIPTSLNSLLDSPPARNGALRDVIWKNVAQGLGRRGFANNEFSTIRMITPWRRQWFKENKQTAPAAAGWGGSLARSHLHPVRPRCSASLARRGRAQWKHGDPAGRLRFPRCLPSHCSQVSRMISVWKASKHNLTFQVPHTLWDTQACTHLQRGPETAIYTQNH